MKKDLVKLAMVGAVSFMACTEEWRKNLGTIWNDIRAIFQLVWAQVDKFLPPTSSSK